MRELVNLELKLAAYVNFICDCVRKEQIGEDELKDLLSADLGENQLLRKDIAEHQEKIRQRTEQFLKSFLELNLTRLCRSVNEIKKR